MSTKRITHADIVADDAFRKAFSAICRRALPYMAEDAYHMDLLYDAAQATQLGVGERLYILVRKLGTNTYGYPDDAVNHCDPALSDGQAVLRVMRGPYDTFTVTVHYDRKSGHYAQRITGEPI
jgi:hypothetical protein